MKLAEWSTHPVHLRYAREIHWPSADEDGVDYVVLRLVTDDGLVGVAEGNAKLLWSSVNWRVLCVILEELLIPLIHDVDLLDPRAVARAIGRVREHRTARSMVEAACWDLRAQALGKPLWQIWGGDSEVAVSWTVTRQAPTLMADEAGTMVDQHGFRTLKVKTGQSRELDRAALKEIRAAVGPDVEMMIDANGSYPEGEAPDYLRELGGLGVTFAEDPCNLKPNRKFEELQAASPIPILVDRGCTNADEAELWLDRGARALSLPASYGESQRMAALALPTHCCGHVGFTSGASLGALAALQVQSALPTREYSLPSEASFFLMYPEEYATEPLRVEEGKVRLPETPGHAQWIDWERVQALRPA